MTALMRVIVGCFVKKAAAQPLFSLFFHDYIGGVCGFLLRVCTDHQGLCILFLHFACPLPKRKQEK